MAYKVFLIPARNFEWAESELNHFLKTHRVLSMQREWVNCGLESYWSVLVDYLETTVKKEAAGPVSHSARRGIDYKEVLSAEEFEVFAHLSLLRKEIATNDGIQLFSVFTNEQLAKIVQSRVATTEQLSKIPGVGDIRVQKYGPRVLEYLKKCWSPGHEASNGAVRQDR
jgi:superfamily II DNA helicase RecQ